MPLLFESMIFFYEKRVIKIILEKNYFLQKHSLHSSLSVRVKLFCIILSKKCLYRFPPLFAVDKYFWTKNTKFMYKRAEFDAKIPRFCTNFDFIFNESE